MTLKLNLILASAVSGVALAQPSPPAKSDRAHKDTSTIATKDVSLQRVPSATKAPEPQAADRSVGNLRPDDLAKDRKAPPPNFESIKGKPRLRGNLPSTYRKKE